MVRDAAVHKLLCWSAGKVCLGQSETCPHTPCVELKLTMKETEVYQTPTATSYFSSCRRQMIDSCMNIHTLTVQKDNSVIICGPDFQPNNTDEVLSSVNPLVKTIKCHFWEWAVTLTTRDKTVEASIWYKVVQITTLDGLQISTFNFGTKADWKSSRQIIN